MTRRRCCCGCTTYIWDTFHGDDTSDLGEDWTEEAGDWERDTNELACDGTSGVLLCTKKAPSFPFRVCADLSALNPGDAARLYFDWTDEDNHSYLEITDPVGTDPITYAIYQVVAATPTKLWERSNAAMPKDVGLCVYDDQVAVTSTAGGDHTYPFAFQAFWGIVFANFTSTVCGLGTGSTWTAATSRFDHFTIEKHGEDSRWDTSGEDPEGVNGCWVCGECSGSEAGRVCLWGSLQDEYTITIPAFSCSADCTGSCTGCSSLAGDYVVSYDPSTYAYCIWRYVFDPPLVLNCTSPSATFTITQLCMDFGNAFVGTYFHIYFIYTAVASSPQSPAWRVAADSENPVACDGLSNLEIPAYGNAFSYISGLFSRKILCTDAGASAYISS